MLTLFADRNLADGSYELGSYSPLRWKEHKGIVMVDKFHGKVLSQREMNGYDDSDFYATVWDDEKDAPREIVYASTRGWTYSCGCTIDATDEVFAKYDAWVVALKDEWTIYRGEIDKRIPQRGKTARSTTVRGKAKGFKGLITLVTDSKFSRGKVIRLTNLDGISTYVEADKCEIWDDESESWLACANWVRGVGGWQVSEKVLPSPQKVL
jgi:hypothetical protein